MLTLSDANTVRVVACLEPQAWVPRGRLSQNNVTFTIEPSSTTCWSDGISM